MSGAAEVRFSRLAERDLDDIIAYIAQDNLERAELFADEIESHCRKIAELPRSFPLRSDLQPGMRVAVHENYLIFFREEIGGSHISITRILHSARNLPRLFRR